jgi:hypothetical protein
MKLNFKAKIAGGRKIRLAPSAMLYHGGPKVPTLELYQPSFWTDDYEAAETYKPKGGKIHIAQLLIHNAADRSAVDEALVAIGLDPMLYDFPLDGNENFKHQGELVAELKRRGFDGAVIEDIDLNQNDIETWCVFDADQIIPHGYAG